MGLKQVVWQNRSQNHSESRLSFVDRPSCHADIPDTVDIVRASKMERSAVLPALSMATD